VTSIYTITAVVGRI